MLSKSIYISLRLASLSAFWLIIGKRLHMPYLISKFSTVNIVNFLYSEVWGFYLRKALVI